MSEPADWRDLVAVVGDKRVRVERDPAGRLRLPVLEDTGGWAKPLCARVLIDRREDRLGDAVGLSQFGEATQRKPGRPRR